MGILFITLSFLMTPVPAADSSPTPAAPGDSELSDLVQLTGCTAELDCGGGFVAQCSGANTCTVGPTYVECDGVRTQCGCSVQTTCCNGNRISCSGVFCEVWEESGVQCTDENGNKTFKGCIIQCPQW